MAEYIEREVVIAKCKEIASCEWNHRASPVSLADAYEQFAEDVEELPAADVAPVVHGRWIETYHEGYEMWGYDCSECDDGFATKERCKSKPNYCHNCGAKMDLEG